jgi:hypothetical protein
MRAILEQLDAEVGYEVRWRVGALDRLLDERHARLVGLATQLLVGAGWEVIPELTYSTYGERGSIDLLGWSAASRHLIVVEVKTELVSVEATLRKLDEKVRLAPAVARERLGWQAELVSRLLILPGDNTSRRRTLRHAAVLDRALPDRSGDVRAWLRQPARSIAGILFVDDS